MSFMNISLKKLNNYSCYLRTTNISRYKEKLSLFNKTNVALYSSYLDTNTNVVKDAIIYKYENPRYFTLLSVFGLVQLGFWTYLSHFTYTTLRDAPIPETDKSNKSIAWYRKLNLGEQKYKNGLAACCGLVGCLMFVSAWLYTFRSVRCLILRKGGKTISFVTYTPLSRDRIMEIPVTNISATESRERAKVTIPVKVKSRWFHYMIDMKGEFLKPELFDATVGLHRKF